MNFNESQTRKNLARAFAAECQAGARYQFMATKAQNEKLFFVKDTMKALAKNEMAHAKLFYDYIVSNSENDKVEFEADYSYLESELDISLEKESKIERNEFKVIYPEFADIARKEGYESIANSFELVAKVEQSHQKILEYLNKLHSTGKMYDSKTKRLFRCTNCGHLAYQTSAWKTCPLCSLDQGYIAIDYNSIFESCVKSTPSARYTHRHTSWANTEAE